jgi:hypothetical protein
MHLYLFDPAVAFFFLSFAAANTKTVPVSLNRDRADTQGVEPTLRRVLSGRQSSPAIHQGKRAVAEDWPERNRANGAAEVRS